MGDIDNPIPDAGSTKGSTETKTKAASFAAFLLSGAFLTVLSSVDTDMVNSLPDWLETPVYSLLFSLGVFATSYNTKHKPGKLSASALLAAVRSRSI